mmetsp:Transcript_2818/g.4281  ORF Transcript_2818/g.4281 Transcript_2818/m.4281 type:complete len:244 (+) Transcript_2818:58-789(+)
MFAAWQNVRTMEDVEGLLASSNYDDRKKEIARGHYKAQFARVTETSVQDPLSEDVAESDDEDDRKSFAVREEDKKGARDKKRVAEPAAASRPGKKSAADPRKLSAAFGENEKQKMEKKKPVQKPVQKPDALVESPKRIRLAAMISFFHSIDRVGFLLLTRIVKQVNRNTTTTSLHTLWPTYFVLVPHVAKSVQGLLNSCLECTSEGIPVEHIQETKLTRNASTNHALKKWPEICKSCQTQESP